MSPVTDMRHMHRPGAGGCELRVTPHTIYLCRGLGSNSESGVVFLKTASHRPGKAQARLLPHQDMSASIFPQGVLSS